jgi:mono/diheme cytochrome c family protein
LTVSKSDSQGHPANDKSEIERGRYLLEEVAKCAECHTPRDANGDLKHDAWLQGAPIWISPVKPIRNWADRAPALAGFPSFTEEQGERFWKRELVRRAKC